MGNYSGVTIFALKITAKISKLSIKCEKYHELYIEYISDKLHFEVRVNSVYGIVKSVIFVIVCIETKVCTGWFFLLAPPENVSILAPSKIP